MHKVAKVEFNCFELFFLRLFLPCFGLLFGLILVVFLYFLSGLVWVCLAVFELVCDCLGLSGLVWACLSFSGFV